VTTEILGEKLNPLPLYPKQTQHELEWHGTQTCLVRRQWWLPTWTMMQS